MENDTWISIHRKFKDWQWYKNTNVKTLFLHLLLKVNYKDNYWKDVLVKRGQTLTSIEHLANETGLTVQQTRTALSKLKSTREITIETTSKYSLITIEKYDIYQRNNKNVTSTLTSEITNNQQTNNKQVTTNNKDNNIYLFLFNKYKAKIETINSKDFGSRIKIISELKNEKDYNELLTPDEQDRMFNELINI